MHLHLINTWATTGVMSVPNKFFFGKKRGKFLFYHQIPLGQFKALSCMLGMPIGDYGQPYSCYDCP
jgi:hypothetical protein